MNEDIEFYNQLKAMIKIESMDEATWEKLYQCACKRHEQGTDSFGKCLTKCLESSKEAHKDA